ncbi:MAG: hypothetical protein VYA54_09670 [Bdellovibrionota bacterium]|nr:hypothetical protein [Bdellovibrionota bacterium]
MGGDHEGIDSRLSLVKIDYIPLSIENQEFISCVRTYIEKNIKLNVRGKETKSVVKNLGFLNIYKRTPLKILLLIDNGYSTVNPSVVNKANKQFKIKK